MIRTKDAAAAMRFMVEARRLGLDPVAMEAGGAWEMDCKAPEMGEALWELLRPGAFEPGVKICSLDLQAWVDERDRFSDMEERLERQALTHLDAAAAWRGGETISDRNAALWEENQRRIQAGQRAWAYTTRTNADW